MDGRPAARGIERPRAAGRYVRRTGMRVTIGGSPARAANRQEDPPAPAGAPNDMDVDISEEQRDLQQGAAPRIRLPLVP